MFDTYTQEQIETVVRISTKMAATITYSSSPLVFLKEDITQLIIEKLLPACAKYQPGKQSLNSYLYSCAVHLRDRIVRDFNTDIRGEVLHRQLPHQKQLDNDSSEPNYLWWVENLVSQESKAALCVDVRERLQHLTGDERLLLDELVAGIPPKDSALGWTRGKRRAVHDALKERFDDLREPLAQM